MANASVPICCKLCNSQLTECRQRQRLFGERTIHVVPTAIRLLRVCVPGSALSVSDAEDILRAPVADDIYLCKSPCYMRLNRMMKNKMKGSHRDNIMLKKRLAASDSAVDCELSSSPSEAIQVSFLPLAKKRPIFCSENSSLSPVVTVSYT